MNPKSSFLCLAAHTPVKMIELFLNISVAGEKNHTFLFYNSPNERVKMNYEYKESK